MINLKTLLDNFFSKKEPVMITIMVGTPGRGRSYAYKNRHLFGK